ncbi:DUF4386 domain-containing protein [Phycicoccus sp. MAQZ13P-2]|uniref:DUF4386 domain-containing protein n=1 Tax=Phycicoccus mangrovi TaxID=2840470 RepID=UPI001BFFE70F|nr:DUF4386 domain-containing protein [Phycicoccus mangrovi]MBT9256860.1 DUF4386 domain-containing protein [Phycicoccus mangrovi]MBT9274991.1 DUF4386 domain-containing protein [Phycicoccus mangrovi]
MTTRQPGARTAGALFLLTHVTSVGALLLYGPGGVDPGHDLADRGAVLAGAALETVLAVAVVGTALALHGLLRDRAPVASTAYVALRALEAAVILAGVLAVLAAVAVPGSDGSPAGGEGARAALTGLHAWAFVVGPGLVCPVNTVVLALVLHRERMVARWIPLLGLVGGPLIGVVNLAVLAGVTGPVAVAALPIFAWEVSLAVHLLVRGVRTGVPSAAVLPREVAATG